MNWERFQPLHVWLTFCDWLPRNAQDENDQDNAADQTDDKGEVDGPYYHSQGRIQVLGWKDTSHVCDVFQALQLQ